MTASLVPHFTEDGTTQPNRREAYFASPLAMYGRNADRNVLNLPTLFQSSNLPILRKSVFELHSNRVARRLADVAEDVQT